MGQMTDLLVKDDTVTTPIEFTLKPVSDNPPLWRAGNAGVPIDGQVKLGLAVERLKNQSYKTTMKLEVPVLETLGASGTSAGYVAPPKVAYVTTAILTMFSDPRSTTQNRADCLKMILGAAQGASATTATGVLNQASAGNAFVNSVLPVTNAFVQSVAPS